MTSHYVSTFRWGIVWLLVSLGLWVAFFIGVGELVDYLRG